jgi:hypothetical protein
MQAIITELIRKIRIKDLELTTKKYPVEMEYRVQNAIGYKRNEQYEKAVSIYIELINEYPSTAFIMFLYKVVAPAGFLKEAAELLNLSSNAYEQSPSKLTSQFGIQSNMDFHRDKLLESIKSRKQLLTYLSSISGNPNYKFARDYDIMTNEIKTFFNL